MFYPDLPMTRMQVVKCLSLFVKDNEPLNSDPLPFTDVYGQLNRKYVKWALDRGITSGTTATTFSPDSNITRQQFCVMLYAMYLENSLLSVRGVMQGPHPWCWAASATMAGSYQVNDPPIAIESIVMLEKGGMLVDEGGTSYEIADGASFASNHIRTFNVNEMWLSFNSLKNLMKSYLPIITCGHIPDDETRRHAMVIVGYESHNNMVYYINPQTGYVSVTTYLGYRSGTTTNYNWDTSIY